MTLLDYPKSTRSSLIRLICFVNPLGIIPHHFLVPLIEKHNIVLVELFLKRLDDILREVLYLNGIGEVQLHLMEQLLVHLVLGVGVLDVPDQLPRVLRVGERRDYHAEEDHPCDQEVSYDVADEGVDLEGEDADVFELLELLVVVSTEIIVMAFMFAVL